MRVGQTQLIVADTRRLQAALARAEASARRLQEREDWSVGHAAFWMQHAGSTQGSTIETLTDGVLLEEIDCAISLDPGYRYELLAEAVRRGLAEDPDRRVRARQHPEWYRA